MAERATELNRRRTAALIAQCARALAEERGLDGFTMDDLAQSAGVSRRTLFNYAAGKLDAVLGVPVTPDQAIWTKFRNGGPTGRLGDDVKAAVAAILDSSDVAPQDWDRVRRLIAGDVRLQKAMHDKFARFTGFLAEALSEREGQGLDPLAAQAAATVTLSLFDVALDAYIADPNTSLAKHYRAAFDGAATLFA